MDYRVITLQRPPSALLPHFVNTTNVCDYSDDTLAIFHGPRCLARYSAGGELLDHAHAQVARAAFASRRPVDMWTIRVPRTGCASPVFPKQGNRGIAHLRPHMPTAPNHHKVIEQRGQLACYIDRGG